MQQRLKYGVLVISLISIIKAEAFHEAAFGLQALSYANNAIMTSPPLPMLYMKGGESQYTVQYAPFTGTASGDNAGFHTQGEIKGNGGSLSYNKAFSDTWGFYLLGVYNKISGEFSYTNLTCSPFCNTTSMRDIEADATSISAGLNWTLIGGSESDFFTLGLLLGGSANQTTMSQRVVQVDSSNTTTDDFKMKTAPNFPALALGMQVGLKFGGFVVNPYFIGLTTFADSDCFDYTVTETTISGSLPGQSSPTCSAGGTQNKVFLKTGFGSLGVRLQYRPWGITINAISFLEEPSEVDLKSLKINTVLIAFAF